MAFISVSKTRNTLTLQVKIPLLHKYEGAGVALFQEINGKVCVLLGKRVNAPFAEKWTFPGGGRERNEALFSTATREFREETGCTLLGRFIKRMGYLDIKRPLYQWKTVLIETSQPIAPVKSKWTKLYGGEFYDMRWVPLEDLDDFNLHPFVMKAINAYMKKGVMKKYTPKVKKTSKKTTKKSSYYTDRGTVKAPEFKCTTKKAITTRRVENDCSMRLTRVDKDGTRYFEPVYSNYVAQASR